MKAADDNGMARCVSCNKLVHYKDADGGHWLPKGASSRWALEECNVHLQCKGCNGFGMKHGAASQAYTLHMIDMFGKDHVAHMIATKNQVHKLYKADYEDMIKDFRAQIKEQEKRLK